MRNHSKNLETVVRPILLELHFARHLGRTYSFESWVTSWATGHACYALEKKTILFVISVTALLAFSNLWKRTGYIHIIFTV